MLHEIVTPCARCEDAVLQTMVRFMRLVVSLADNRKGHPEATWNVGSWLIRLTLGVVTAPKQGHRRATAISRSSFMVVSLNAGSSKQEVGPLRKGGSNHLKRSWKRSELKLRSTDVAKWIPTTAARSRRLIPIRNPGCSRYPEYTACAAPRLHSC